ncbi:hypothetical protein PV328_001360 [Microctonus aethiopoides]|uniref:Uncharacterized protein n=1 Tax=Microctonus aethiopoides TaxID=144406 RepID=A0AA39FWS1_9HYME|nr:hypothetical protein PV328_001360 [Microctonus aethiopoides]
MGVEVKMDDEIGYLEYYGPNRDQFLGNCLKWHTRVKRHISDFKIPAQVWNWQDGSNDAKSLQGPSMKFVTSYQQPAVCELALLHIALHEIFCLCVVKVEIFLTSEANQ